MPLDPIFTRDPSGTFLRVRDKLVQAAAPITPEEISEQTKIPVQWVRFNLNRLVSGDLARKPMSGFYQTKERPIPGMGEGGRSYA